MPVERFQIYQLTVPVVPPGGVRNVPLQLDTDAPFALRWMTSRNIGLNGWRFQTPRKQWQSDQLRTDWSISATITNSHGARGVVFYPNLVYPIGSQIIVDIGNDTDEDILNARLVFRGVKIFAPGAILSPTYPPRFETLPFTYGQNVQIGLATGPAQPATAPVVFTIKQSWDFAFRYGVCDPYTPLVEGGITPPGGDITASLENTFVMLRDESKKAYMNEPICINDVFGSTIIQGLGVNADYIGDGPNFPGLIVPEIYMPQNTAHYVDVYRFDEGDAPINLNFRFQGATVLAK